MQEIWKPIFCAESHYEISNLGRARRIVPIDIMRRNFSNHDIEIIFMLKDFGFNQPQIARFFNKSTCSVGRIINGINYKNTGTILKPSLRQDGYQTIAVYVNTKRTFMTVHSAVAKAFIGDRPTGYDINHIDGNKSNNRVDNLEYCTHRDNAIHALYVINKGKKLNPEKVKYIFQLHELGHTPNTISIHLDVSPSTIRRVINKKIWNHI